MLIHRGKITRCGQFTVNKHYEFNKVIKYCNKNDAFDHKTLTLIVKVTIGGHRSVSSAAQCSKRKNFTSCLIGGAAEFRLSRFCCRTNTGTARDVFNIKMSPGCEVCGTLENINSNYSNFLYRGIVDTPVIESSKASDLTSKRKV